MTDNKMHNPVFINLHFDLYELTANIRKNISLKDMINHSLSFVVFCPVHSFRDDISSVLIGSLNAFLLPSTHCLSACKILLLLSPTECRQLAGLSKAWVALGLFLVAFFVDLGTLGCYVERGFRLWDLFLSATFFESTKFTKSCQWFASLGNGVWVPMIMLSGALGVSVVLDISFLFGWSWVVARNAILCPRIFSGPFVDFILKPNL